MAKVCFLCGKNGSTDPLDKHHIFGGANRDKSEADGLYVYLCHHDCHIFGKYAAHSNRKTAQFLHEFGEIEWLKQDSKRTVKDFISRYGKNYLPFLEYVPSAAEYTGFFEITDEEAMPY